jgi:sugar/nucleoside kinase (ribokinase family)
MSKQPFEIIGLGASTVDILTHVERFPTRREVQQALSMAIQGGGPVATAMVAASRLGMKVAMIDSIGEDWAGAFVLREFQNERVATSLIEVHRGQKTAVSNILVSAVDGARAILFVPGTTPEPVVSEAQKTAIQSAKILHVNGRYWTACMQAVDLAKRSGVRISFDGGADRFKPEMKSLVPLTDICIVARDFAEKYTGEADPSLAAKSLLEEGPGIAAVTDGVHGSWVCTREACFHQPAFPFPKVVDTTGCGDSYHGAFLAALVKGFTAEKAATFASAVAGMNTQQVGGRMGIPTFDEVKKFLNDRGSPL